MIVSPSIGETLDHSALEWSYNINEYGERGWIIQDEVSYDGSPSIEFLLTDRTRITFVDTYVDGPVILTYWKKTEIAPETAIAGSYSYNRSSDWKKVSIAYPDEGPQNIKIGFFQSLPTGTFLGRMWVDNVEFDYSPIITKNLEYASVRLGQSHAFEIQAASLAPVFYQWMRDGLDMPGEVDSTLSLENISTSDTGYYNVRIANEHGSVVSNAALLGAFENLGDAAEQPDIEWTFGDRAKWFAQSEITRDGVDALMCVLPNEPDPQENWMRANIQGPFRLSYWTKVDNSGGEHNASHSSLAPNFESSPWEQRVIEWNSEHPPVAVISVYSEAPNAKIYIDQIEIFRTPFIESHPKPTSVSNGQTITFQVEVDSATPVTYQWLKGSVPIPGATSSRLSLPNAGSADSGVYSVRTTNDDGTVISKPVTANVFPAFQSIGQAFEQTSLAWTRSSDGSWYVQDDISFDGSLTLEVHAGDNNGNTWFESTIDGPVTVQFFYISENDIEMYIDGERSHLLGDVSGWTPFAFTLVESGPHTVRWVLDDYYEGRRFWFDRLTVSHGPIITEHPQSSVAGEGDLLELDVSAVSQSPINYQWRKDGIDLPGADEATISIPTVKQSDYGTYDVVLTNGSASTNSIPVSVTSPESINLAIDIEGLDWTLTGEGTIEFQTVLSRDHIDALAFITGNPISYEPEIGIETTFEGPATIEYWYLEGDTTPGIFRPTIDDTIYSLNFSSEFIQRNAYQSWSKVEIPVVDPGSHSLQFTLRRYGNYDTEKRAFLDQLEINQAPLVTDDLPRTTLLHLGEPLTLALSAASGSDIAYQWRKDGVPIAGAIDEAYTILDPQDTDTGYYDVVLSNSYGETISSSTQLILNESLQDALGAPNLAFKIEGKGTIKNSTAASNDGRFGLRIDVEPGEIFTLETSVSSPAKTSFWWREDPSNCARSRAWIELNDMRQWSEDSGPEWSFHQIDGTDQVSNELRWSFFAFDDCTATFYLDSVTIASDQLIVNQPTDLTGHLGEHFEIQFDWWNTTGVSFQWRKDGVSIEGATDRDYHINSFQASDAGIYDLAITTDSGTTYSEPIEVTTFADRISSAIEAQGRIWTTSDPRHWQSVMDEGYDGQDALLLLSESASDQPWIETVIEGPATVSYWWRTGGPISGYSDRCNQFEFYVDGKVKREIDDENNWREERVMVSDEGLHTLRWGLPKGWCSSRYAAMLDSVSIISGPTIGIQPISKITTEGTATELSIRSTSKGVSYQWRHDGVNIEGATGKIYAAILPGAYDVVVSNGQHSRISDSATVEWIEPIGHLVEQPNLPWKMPDGPVWRASENDNFDGEDALISPDYPTTSEAWLSTTVEGPINLSFAYRVANESRDRIRASFYVDDRRTKLYDVTNPWGTHQYTIPWRKFNYSIEGEGPHELRWELSELRYIVDIDGPRFYLDHLLLFQQPVFVTQPDSQGLFVSDSLFLTSGATSPTRDDLVTYQWYKDGVSIPGATSNVFSISVVDRSDSGNYLVKASNSSGESTSDTAQITVLESPSDLLELGENPFPVGNFQTARPGTLELYLEGPATLEFDWKLKLPYENVSFVLETNGDERRKRSGPDDWETERLYLGEGIHHVKWSLRGLISNLKLNKKPFIETPSSEVHSFIGEKATMTAEVLTPTPATLQWYHGDQPIPGATATTLTLIDLEQADAGDYSLHATNDFGTSIANPIILNIFERPGILFGLTEFDFLFSGEGQWSPPDSQNNSLCGPVLNHGQKSSASTFVNGPVSIAFEARFFDQNLDHKFEFQVDGQLVYSHNSNSHRSAPPIRHTIAEPGEHELTWTVIANENETAGSIFTCIENLEIVADLGSIYDEWSQLLFPETATEHEKDMQADPDGDTKSNLLEYLLGSDPLVADGPVDIEVIEKDGSYYWETNLELIAWVDGIDFAFETSSNLSHWEPLETDFELQDTGERTLLKLQSGTPENLKSPQFSRIKLSYQSTVL